MINDTILELQERVNELEKHNKALVKRLEGAKHPKHGYSRHRFTRNIRVRWDFDPIAEMVTILLKMDHNRGIILEVPEAACFERGDSFALFPRYAVRGAIGGNNISAHELRNWGIPIAKDIPAGAIIPEDAFEPIDCALDYNEETKRVMGILKFVIKEPFAWEKRDDEEDRGGSGHPEVPKGP